MGFGFAYADGRRYDSGFFKDKTGMLCLTTGGTVERFLAGNVYGPIEQVLYPTEHLMLDYLGMKSYPPFATYAAPRINAAGPRGVFAAMARPRAGDRSRHAAALQRGLSICRREYRT